MKLEYGGIHKRLCFIISRVKFDWKAAAKKFAEEYKFNENDMIELFDTLCIYSEYTIYKLDELKKGLEPGDIKKLMMNASIIDRKEFRNSFMFKLLFNRIYGAYKNMNY